MTSIRGFQNIYRNQQRAAITGQGNMNLLGYFTTKNLHVELKTLRKKHSLNVTFLPKYSYSKKAGNHIIICPVAAALCFFTVSVCTQPDVSSVTRRRSLKFKTLMVLYVGSGSGSGSGS